MSNSDNWFQRNPKKTYFIIIILFTIFLDIIAGSIFIPKIYNIRTPHSYYHHDLLPNKYGKEIYDNINYFITTNSLGFRDGEIREIPNKSDKKRILLIGDSFTEGFKLDYKDTFSRLLSGMLENKNIEILNAGIVSYSPHLYYLKTKYLLEKIKLQFDYLYVFIDISDIQDEIFYENYDPKTKIHQFNWFLYDFNKKMKSISYIFCSLSNLFKNFKKSINYIDYFGGIFFYANKEQQELLKDPRIESQRESWTDDPAIYNRWREKGLSLAADNMQKLEKLCASYKIPMTIVFYPWPYQIKQNYTDCIQERFWNNFAQQHRIECIDLFPDFIKKDADPEAVIDKYFIKDDVHWNKYGHEIVANKIFNHIIQEKRY